MVGGISIGDYGYRYKELVREKYPLADSRFDYKEMEWQIWSAYPGGQLLASSDNPHRAWRNAYQMHILRKDRSTSHLWISMGCR